jgi:hypothetical protein
MIYPNVFIEKKFWQILEEERTKINFSNPFDFDTENTAKRNSFERILALIRGSNIITDEFISDSDFKQINKLNDNAKSIVIKEIIKSTVFVNGRKISDGKNINAFEDLTDISFLSGDEISICIKNSMENGHIHIGKEFLKQEFFLNNSFPVEQTQKDLSKLDKLFHPCNSLVIIDPYLFTSFDKKKPYLFAFLKKIIPETLKKTFELDIIVKNKDRYNEVSYARNQILAEFNNISLHIYHTKELNDNESDRYLITNYSLISVGHPFDRESNISSNFFPSNSNENLVIQSYNTRFKKLEFIKKIIDKTPNELIGNKCILMNDNKKHRIFNFNTFS